MRTKANRVVDDGSSSPRMIAGGHRTLDAEDDFKRKRLRIWHVRCRDLLWRGDRGVPAERRIALAQRLRGPFPA